MSVYKTEGSAVIPTRGSSFAAGYDLSSVETLTINPGDRACVSTGLKIAIPKGWYGRIAPRSGLAVKNGIHVGAGVIDEDYLGVIKVVIFNLGREPFIITPGMRIAQLIFEVYGSFELKEVMTESELGNTSRGEQGFGSTGVQVRLSLGITPEQLTKEMTKDVCYFH
jgi:dUTP pyrophosphatase